jgi:ABC-type multidrug transport system fused ATPase/permease subunit
MIVENLTLETDEHVLIQVRKHWFVLALQILSILIVTILPLILIVLILKTIAIPFDVSEYVPVAVALYTAWLLIMWMALFSVWTNYYLDVWTITTKRLIAVDQRGFFFRTTASFRLERLQDTIVSVDGILATLLNYGSLEVQTAGEEKNFKGYGLPNPGNLKGIILQATDTLLAQSRPNTHTIV